MKARNGLFLGFVLICAVVAVGYVASSAARNVGQATVGARPVPTAGNVTAVASKPHVLALNRSASGDYNALEFHELTTTQASPTAIGAGMRCERVYFGGGHGVCILRTYDNPMTAVVSATIFDADLQPLFALKSEGIPSRARVSADGRYAAFTTFVSGHSYLDAQLSTRTMIVDITNKNYVGDLETFQVMKDGQPFSAVDFNFWGVTFAAADSNLFYATLRTSGETWLVRGDVQQKRMTVLHKGVECPSLSPDGTRIAFKKLQANRTWRLHVLDLATMTETPLAETRNIDDQVEWLDDQHVIYEWSQAELNKVDVMQANADGSGTSTVFMADSGSPSVVRGAGESASR